MDVWNVGKDLNGRDILLRIKELTLEKGLTSVQIVGEPSEYEVH